MPLQTCQVRLSGEQLRGVDRLVRKGVYPNRSEAVREAVRIMLRTNGLREKKGLLRRIKR